MKATMASRKAAKQKTKDAMSALRNLCAFA